MAVTKDVNIGSYIGVPVRFSDGQIIGTLCGLDPLPRRFGPLEVAFLQVLARFAGAVLEKGYGVRQGGAARKANPTLKDTRLMLDGVLSSIRSEDQPVVTTTAVTKSAWQNSAILIDSTILNRQPVTSWLTQAGYRVQSLPGRSSYERIERALHEQNVSMLVIAEDDSLEDQLELIRQLRQRAATLRLPILFLTRQRLTCVRAYYAGASRCLLYTSSAVQYRVELEKLAGLPVGEVS